MKKLNSKILICVVPSVSLIRKYPYMETPLGSAILSGVFKKAGYQVDYYDLNVSLNSTKRAKETLNEKEHRILSNLNKLREFIKLPDKSGLIYKQIVNLLKTIKGNKYDYILLSLERKSKKPLVFERAIFFAMALSSILKKKYNCPIFLGGSVACYAFGVSRLEKITKEFKDIPIDGFFVRAKAREFLRFIQAVDNSSKKIIIDKHLGAILSNKFTRSLNSKLIELNGRIEGSFVNIKNVYCFPEYNLENKKELILDFKSILPKTVINQYPTLNKIRPFYIAPYLFSWGCPFRCGFCMTGSIDFSFLSAKKVVGELEKIIEKYSITNFRFYNSQINFNEKYIFDFCNEIKKRNLKIKFSDSGNLFFTSKEIFQALKEAGCIKIWFGAETLSPRLQKAYKRGLSYKGIVSGLNNSHEAGIWNAINLIVNFPFESEKEFNQLVNFMNNHQQVIDCWESNNFMLHQDADIFCHPKRFRVRILETKDLTWGYNYDEIGGLKWGKKLEVGKKRLNILRNNFSYAKNLIFRNDYLLFGLSDRIGNKLEIKRIFNSLIDYFQSNPGLSKTDNIDNIEKMNLLEYAKYIHPESL